MRIHVKTFGCSANIAESEMMAGMLSAEHDLCDLEESDAIIINSCTVKGDNTVLRHVKNIKRQHPHKRIIVGGCLSPTLRKSIAHIAPDSSFLTTQNIRDITTLVNTHQPTTLLVPNPAPKLRLPRKRTHPGIAIIPISSGCMDHCTYCSTKLSKGNLVSYSSNDIIAETREAISEGCSHLWLTSQDTSCYGQDIGTNLAQLLEQLTALNSDLVIRVGMGNPTYFLEYQERLARIMQHPRIYKFLHIPLQSGSDNVLASMKRRYTVKDYAKLITYLRTQIPQLMLATDIIVGFPGETDDDFMRTCQAVTQLRFDVVNISRYVARKGTLAHRMPQIEGATKNARSRQLSELAHRISHERNNEWVGWSGNVIVERLAKPGSVIARNISYRHIIVPGEYAPGTIIPIRITRATTHHLVGEVHKTTQLNIVHTS